MLFALLAMGCANVDTPYSYVDLDNHYPAGSTVPLVIYQAYWQAIAFQSPVSPGASSGPQASVPASDNTAYALLAPGWNPASSSPPSSFVVLQSRSGFALHLNDTLHIPVDDTTFAGRCAAGSFLTQTQADAITQLVFPTTFRGLQYDATTCGTTPVGDSGVE